MFWEPPSQNVGELDAGAGGFYLPHKREGHLSLYIAPATVCIIDFVELSC